MRAGLALIAALALCVTPAVAQGKVKSKGGTDGRAFDRLSGLLLPPRGESAFYHNVNLWYDDGRINARKAVSK